MARQGRKERTAFSPYSSYSYLCFTPICSFYPFIFCSSISFNLPLSYSCSCSKSNHLLPFVFLSCYCCSDSSSSSLLFPIRVSFAFSCCYQFFCPCFSSSCLYSCSFSSFSSYSYSLYPPHLLLLVIIRTQATTSKSQNTLTDTSMLPLQTLTNSMLLQSLTLLKLPKETLAQSATRASSPTIYKSTFRSSL